MFENSRMLSILQSTWSDTAGILKEFKKTFYFPAVLRLYGKIKLEELYQSECHGQDHIERVVLLGAVLAWKQQLADVQTEMLLAACSYHDIGRINDGRDAKHGLRSAQKMRTKKLLEDFPMIPEEDYSIVYAAVASHSVYIEDQSEIGALFRISDEQMTDFVKIASLLKNADKLDRVRLGDLDVERFDGDFPKDLVPFAEEVYLKYNPLEIEVY